MVVINTWRRLVDDLDDDQYLRGLLEELEPLRYGKPQKKLKKIREIAVRLQSEVVRLFISLVHSTHAISLLNWLRSLTDMKDYAHLAVLISGILDKATRGVDWKATIRKNRVDKNGQKIVEIKSRDRRHLQQILMEPIRGMAAIIRSMRIGNEVNRIELDMVLKTVGEVVTQLRGAKASTDELQSLSESDMKETYCSKVEPVIRTCWKSIRPKKQQKKEVIWSCCTRFDHRSYLSCF